nr:ATPase domain-containing protein [Candidatus Freyarchaeota archaeon]
MELLSTGIPAFDFLIGGGFERNAQILLLTETGSMGEILPLQIMDFRLKQGDSGLVLDLDLPTARIREWLRHFNFKIEELEKGKKFFLVDGFTNLYGKLQSEEEFVIDEPRDLIHLNTYLYNVIQSMKEYKSSYFNVCFMSNIMLSKGQDIDKIINLIYKSKMLLSECGTSIFVFNKDILDEKSISTLKHIFDYVIEFKVSETNERYKRFLRVSKSPTLDYIDDLIPYELEKKGIALSTEIMEEFNRLKQHLKMPEKGVVELLGTRIIINEANHETQIIKSIIEKYGYEKAGKMIYSQGKEISKSLVEALMRHFKPSSLSEAVPTYARFNTLRGYGKFIGELDEKNNTLRVKHLNSTFCDRYTNLKKPTGFWISGVITGLYEIVTGKKCITEEVKCIAKGDEYCEYITKPINT